MILFQRKLHNSSEIVIIAYCSQDYLIVCNGCEDSGVLRGHSVRVTEGTIFYFPLNDSQSENLIQSP